MTKNPKPGDLRIVDLSQPLDAMSPEPIRVEAKAADQPIKRGDVVRTTNYNTRFRVERIEGGLAYSEWGTPHKLDDLVKAITVGDLVKTRLAPVKILEVVAVHRSRLFFPGGEWLFEFEVNLKTPAAEVAADIEVVGEVELKVCQWKTEGEFWETECGDAFYFTTIGGPADNSFEFCPFCGSLIGEIEDQ